MQKSERVVKKIGKDEPWRLKIELTDDEMAAIGRITVQWAFLEHLLLLRTADAAQMAGLKIPLDAASAAFTKRLRAWRLLVEETVADLPEKTRDLKLVSQIANAEGDRHKITHGLWDWDDDNPEVLRASSFRPRFQFEKKLDLKALTKLADKIAEINYRLYLPEGLLDAEIVPSPSRFQKLGLAFIYLMNPVIRFDVRSALVAAAHGRLHRPAMICRPYHAAIYQPQLLPARRCSTAHGRQRPLYSHQDENSRQTRSEQSRWNCACGCVT